MIRTALDWLIPRLAWGYVVLTVSVLTLFVVSHVEFAHTHPTYVLTEGWPTMSRALAHANQTYVTLFALLAGPGLLLGSLTSIAIYRDALRHGQASLGLKLGFCLFAAVTPLLCLPLIYMLTITLSDDNRGHMIHSYQFFVGMSFIVLLDGFGLARGGLLLAGREGGEIEPIRRLLASQRRNAWRLLIAAAAFLGLYVAKDLEDWLSQALRDELQKAFVVSEFIWICLSLYHAMTHFFMRRFHRLPSRGPSGASPIIRQMFVTNKGARS